MTQSIRKVVFPVAGLGTRFLPATKASPKEMLPIVDKPLIQYAVEEALDAGMEQLIFITSISKRSIADHFDKNAELEAELERRGKKELLETVQKIVPNDVFCIYIRQPEPLGLGHAVLCAKPVVGNEPFAVILADDLINGGKQPCLKQLIAVHEQQGFGVLAVEKVAKEDTDQYGIVGSTRLFDRVSKITSIVEKPEPDLAPSNLAVVGRYILPNKIFHFLENTPLGNGGEIQLTDAIATLLQSDSMLAYEFKGKRYDCGSKLGYLQASVEYALKHPELHDEFKAYLQNLCPTLLSASE